MKKDCIEVYTDGACSGNPGKGGWAAILIYNGCIKKISDAYRKTTNNRMELKAVIESLKSIKKKDIPIVVHSDSQYVVNCINNAYIEKWKKTGFKNIKNPDLWKELIDLIAPFKHIRFEWVKAHASNALNNECDKIAVNAYLSKDLENQLGIDTFYEKQERTLTNNKS